MISTRFLALLAAAFLAAPLVAGCSSQGPRTDGAAADSERTPSALYIIGPNDRISILVYQSPVLSVPDLPVRPDGRISVPLIPDIVAAGKTSTQLAHDIAERLKQYVKDPDVTIIVNSFLGPFDRQIRVIGEAAEPQSIPYRDHMTLLDVMIATKGITRFAAGDSSVIVRRSGPRKETLKVRLSSLIKDGDIGENVAMRPGDTLIIPQSWF